MIHCLMKCHRTFLGQTGSYCQDFVQIRFVNNVVSPVFVMFFMVGFRLPQNWVMTRETVVWLNRQHFSNLNQIAFPA